MSDQPKAERVFKVWQMLLMAILSALSLVLFGPVAPLAVLGWSAFFMLIANLNKNMRRDSALILAAQDYVLRVRDFLFDNPWISANNIVRRRLLPSERETALMSFHRSLVEEFDEFREGKGWLMNGGARAGASLKLRYETDAIRFLQEKIAQLHEENAKLKIQLQLGAQQVAEERREYGVRKDD